MSEKWIKELGSYLPILNERKVGTNRLSKTDLDLIYTKIIKPFDLSSEKIQNTLFDDNSFLYKDSAFFVLEALVLYENIENGIWFGLLCSKSILSLNIEKKKWNWLINPNTSQCESYYYHKLRILCALIYKAALNKSNVSQSRILELVTTLTYHIHPKLPWTSQPTSILIESFIDNNCELRELIHDLIPVFVNEKLKPELLDLSPGRNTTTSTSLSNPRLTPAGYAISNNDGVTSLRGLRPRLGFGGTKSEIIEEDQRQKWKLSSKVKSISMIWFTIHTIAGNDYLQQYWQIITSFILNLNDDPDPLMKAQSCELLNYFMSNIDDNDNYRNHLLIKTGLCDLFIKSCMTSLSYLPNLTPPDQSQYLLSIAYKVIIRLCALKSKKEGDWRIFVELVNDKILASIAHMHNGSGFNSSYPLISFLIYQLDLIVKNYLQTNVLVCFSRINYTLNQVMINPHIFETRYEGLSCIISALALQNSILQAFQDLNDIEGVNLILSYKYDFLAVWSVLQKRCDIYLGGNRTEILRYCELNFKLLKDLSISAGPNEFKRLQTEVQQIHATNSKLCFPLD